MARVFLLCVVAVCWSFGTSAQEHSHHNKSVRSIPTDHPNVSLLLQAHKDSASGYNLHLVTNNFRFSPENTGKQTENIEGHAHLYVNGRKITRIYSDWFHVTGAMLVAKSNNVVVTLNDNTHKAWAKEGNPIEAIIELEGPEGARIDQEIHIEIGSDEPQLVESKVDQIIRFHLMAEPGLQIHLHGYDQTRKAGPDGKAVMIVKLDHSGRFPLVAHIKDKLTGVKEKAIAYLEVKPK